MRAGRLAKKRRAREERQEQDALLLRLKREMGFG